MPGQPISGWNEFLDEMRDLPDTVFALLPDAMRDDPQVRQEVGRRMLSALAFSTLSSIGGDGDWPIFLPQSNVIMDIGQPNADSSYRVAQIEPGGSYRIRGNRGNLRLCILAQLDPYPGEPGAENLEAPGPARSHLDLNSLDLGADGVFDVLVSPTRPEGYEGDWWKLEPTVNKLFLRMVMGDFARERDGNITIDRVDRPLGGRPRRSAEDLEQRLRRLSKAVWWYSVVEIGHVEMLRRNGFLNKLTEYDTSKMVGLAGQFYFEGAYEITDDEALIVEARIPDDCDYWSVIMTNEIFETTDWYNNHSALNDTQAQVDSDGIVRFVISAKDPGVPNWLDTAGYEKGEFQGRLYNSSSNVLPTMKKVPFAQVRQHLPDDTPVITAEERDQILRERRFLLQSRPMW